MAHATISLGGLARQTARFAFSLSQHAHPANLTSCTVDKTLGTNLGTSQTRGGDRMSLAQERAQMVLAWYRLMSTRPLIAPSTSTSQRQACTLTPVLEEVLPRRYISVVLQCQVENSYCLCMSQARSCRTISSRPGMLGLSRGSLWEIWRYAKSLVMPRIGLLVFSSCACFASRMSYHSPIRLFVFCPHDSSITPSSA